MTLCRKEHSSDERKIIPYLSYGAISCIKAQTGLPSFLLKKAWMLSTRFWHLGHIFGNRPNISIARALASALVKYVMFIKKMQTVSQ